MEWIKTSETLPPKKEGWNHSEQCLVYYFANESQGGGYGISYYHNDPPYSKPGWIDFSQYGRQPDLWMPLPLPPTPPKD